MALRVWLALVTLFLLGGLTPGPAVMLVTTSSLRYGFWAAMKPAMGICAANLAWVVLAASGASALAHAFPLGFLALRVAGLGYILWLAWRMAFSAPPTFIRGEPPPRARLFARGVGLQLANPNALVFFGGLLPAYLDAQRSLGAQCAVIMATVTTTELCGLVTYAAAADGLARRFASGPLLPWLHRGSAFAMAASAVFAVYATR